MKNLMIILLGIWVFILIRDKKQKEQALREPQQASKLASSGGGGVNVPVDRLSQEKIVSKQGAAPVLSAYGNMEPVNAQKLTVDINEADALAYKIGDPVRVLNSNLYNLYYKIVNIIDKQQGVKSVVLNTRYIGPQQNIFLSGDKYSVSGFSTSTNRRGPFV